ncbi:MAG: hypothetical protein AAFW97_14580 [Pseudomonadota bacterium]
MTDKSDSEAPGDTKPGDEEASYDAAFAEASASEDQSAPEAGSDDETAAKAETETEQPAEGDQAEAGKATDDADEGQEASDEAPSAEASDDAFDWNSADPRAKEEFERVQHQARSDAGRVAQLQRRMNDLERQASANEAQGEDQTDVIGQLKTLIESEEYKRAQADYGDELRPLFQTQEQLLAALEASQNQVKSVGERLEETAQRETIQRYEEALSSVEEAHSDWVEQLGSDDFLPWLNEQPRYVQNMFHDNNEAITDAPAAIELIDRFKAHKGVKPAAEEQPSKEATATDARRRKQLEAGQKVETKGPPVTSQIPEDDYDAHFANAKV